MSTIAMSISNGRATNSQLTRKPVLTNVTDASVYNYVVKSCFLEYIRTPRSQNLFRQTAAGETGPLKAIQLHTSLLRCVRKEIDNYPYSSLHKGPVLRDMFRNLRDETEKKNVKERFKEGMTLQELYTLFMQCCGSKKLEPVQVNDITLALLAYLEYCIKKVRSPEKTDSIRTIISDVKRYYSEPVQPPLYQEVAHVFAKPEGVVREDILNYAGKLTELEYMDDLKKLLTDIWIGNDRTTSFELDIDRQSWKDAESEALNQILKLHLASNVHQVDRRNTTYLYETTYSFIPPDAVTHYRRVLMLACQRDLSLGNLSDSMDYLSKESRYVLTMLSTNWRVKKSTRDILEFDVARELYVNKVMNIWTMVRVFQCVESQMRIRVDVKDPWTVQDKILFRNSLMAVYKYTIGTIVEQYSSLFSPPDQLDADIADKFAFIDSCLATNNLFQGTDTEFRDTVTLIRNRVKVAAYNHFLSLVNESNSNNLVIDRWRNVVRHTISAIKQVKARYTLPTEVEGIGITRWSTELQAGSWCADQLANMAATYSKEQIELLREELNRDGSDLGIEDLKDIYSWQCRLRRIFQTETLNSAYPFEVETALFNYVYIWFDKRSNLPNEWVDGIVKAEKFVPKSMDTQPQQRHSTSVFDMWQIFHQQMSLIKELNWQNEYHVAKLYNAVMRSVSKAIRLYLQNLQRAYLLDVKPLSTEYSGKKQKVVSEFKFSSETCVKMNNVEYIKNNLDQLEKSINAEALATVIATKERSVETTANSVFTIEIVEAEGLRGCDSNGLSDPYVELFDQSQKRSIGRTRTIYKDLNPRWNESFEYSVTQSVNIGANIWDEDLFGQRERCGNCIFALDPKEHRDFEPRETWIDVHPQGRLKVVTIMERDRDDILFHFGKAFKDLQRTEDFMVKSIPDQFRVAINSELCLDTIRNVIKPSGLLSSMAKRLLRTNGPEAASTMTRASLEERIGNSIDPFLNNYLLPIFTTLESTLTDTLKVRVMLETWNVILEHLELLIIPPLSEKVALQKPLTDDELAVILSWINVEFLEFFHGEGHGPSIEALKNAEHFKIINLARHYYQYTAEQLERDYNDMAIRNFERRSQIKFHSGIIGRMRTVLAHKNLGTMRLTAKQLREAKDVDNTEEVILRVLALKDVDHRLPRILKTRRQQADIRAVQSASRRSGQVFDRVRNMPAYPRH
ncbi:hypothetical protein V1525DRAFT_371436 [Lipomyces kononenkoae]|uniref:Uncharacterized protein n=1 Tax=Lipomyces kononenkoae TaxID=34357 RepID=A0ACC3T7V2_LIPKO